MASKRHKHVISATPHLPHGARLHVHHCADPGCDRVKIGRGSVCSWRDRHYWHTLTPDGPMVPQVLQDQLDAEDSAYKRGSRLSYLETENSQLRKALALAEQQLRDALYLLEA